MNILNKGLTLALLLSLGLVSGAAQAEQKIAVVDVQRILQSLPQIASIEQSINDEFRDARQEIEKMQSDGNFMVQKLQRESATMSEDEKAKLQEQIQQLSQELQTKAQPLQQDIQRRQNEERQKLFGLIQQSISGIATADGYDLVLNKTAVLFSGQEYDISQKVLDQVSKAN